MNPQAYNRFAYVINNPINLTDPSGHCYYNGTWIPNGQGGTCSWSSGNNGDSGSSGGNSGGNGGGGNGGSGTGNSPVLGGIGSAVGGTNQQNGGYYETVSDFLDGTPSNQEVCSFVFSGISDMCYADYSEIFDETNPYSIPSMYIYSINQAMAAWNAYTPNAFGISGNVSGGYNVIQASAGIDGMYLFDDNAIAAYPHAGPSPSLGGGLSASISVIVGLNVDQVSNYEGGSQSVEVRLAGGLSGIRIGYFWPAFHRPFQPNDPQGFIIGPAVGAAASFTYSAHAYPTSFYYDIEP